MFSCYRHSQNFYSHSKISYHYAQIYDLYPYLPQGDISHNLVTSSLAEVEVSKFSMQFARVADFDMSFQIESRVHEHEKNKVPKAWNM